MIFRLPFQILRAVTRPSSPTKFLNPCNLVHKFQNNFLSALVDVNNNVPLVQKQNTSLPYYITHHSIQRFNSTFKGLPKSTDLENRKKVRKQQKCHKRKSVRKLVFRETTREECEQCINPIQVPDKCPKLARLKPNYDDTKLKWKHEDCPGNICETTPRMDQVKGLKVVKKKLPKIKSDCAQCMPLTPKTAPKLKPPSRDYDPSKLKWNHPDCRDSDTCAPRMDDVCGYKVKPKKLPQIKSDDCPQCTPHEPTCAPKLNRLKKRYDANKLEQKRVCSESICNKDPPRMDDVVGYKVVSKKLPQLPAVNDCPQCAINTVKHMPKLPQLKKRYDPSKMQWEHPVCVKFCDDTSPRIDDLVGLKVTKKQLPKLKSKCEQCIPHLPTISPKFTRLKKTYNDKEMKWIHPYCPSPDNCPLRMDNVLGLTIKKKRLPKLEPSQECTYCKDTVPTCAPKLARLQKEYDDSKMKWQHTGCSDGSEVCTPRSDDVIGYKVKPKVLKKLEAGLDCRLCLNLIPKFAPKLERPEKRYDPSKLNWKHPDCSDFCKTATPRMDDVVGLKVTPKNLPILRADTCPQCLDRLPKYAPKLERLKRRFNPSKLKWKYPDCSSEFCGDAVRMDDIVGLKVTPKKLPKLPVMRDCSQCLNHVPKYAPKLKRPKRKYDPSKMQSTAECYDDLCDLDPPRMDDIKCWKPEKKILPSFMNSNQQKRKFSTLSPVGNKGTYCLYSHKNILELREKAHMYGRRYSKKSKKPKKDKKKSACKAPTPNKCRKPCPKFKVPPCKKPTRTSCEQYCDKPCKKKEAPYGSFGECTDGLYEDGPDECPNWNDIMLQPQKQVSGSFYKMVPPPPRFEHIDPSKERKCLSKAPLCPEPSEHEKPFKNPCRNFKMSFCKERQRQLCEEYTLIKCKKLEAPYKSFTDYCPQFPEVEMTECDLAEKQFKDNNQMVDYRGKAMTLKSEKPSLPEAKNPCKPSKDSCKPKGKKSDCKHKLPKCRQKDKETGNCKPVKFPTRKTKCGSKDDNKITTMVCPPDKDGRKYVCVCKKLSPPNTPTKSTTKFNSTSSMKCGSSSNVKTNSTSSMKCRSSSNVKTMVCTSKDGSKKFCMCKPIKEKSICEPSKKVSSKSACKKPSNSSSCCGFSDMKQKQVCSPSNRKKPLPPPTVHPYSNSHDRNIPKSKWEKLCAYFRARPGCPAPHEWRQKMLEKKARQAAAAAGFEISPPKCTYINISKQVSKHKMIGPKKRDPCKASKISCSKSANKCKPKKYKSKCGCVIPKKKRSSQSCKSSQKLKAYFEKCKQIQKKLNCALPSKSGISKSSKRCKEKRKFSTLAKNRYFSTYSRISKLTHPTKKNTQILSNQNQSPSNVNSYLRLDDRYVGKIYQLKFTQIGLKNSLVARKADEEPYTICHMCKVVPKHQSVFRRAKTN